MAEEERTISLDEAICTLYELIDNPVIEEDLSDKLQEIANHLDHQKYGLHTWGIPEKDYEKLVVAYRDDLTAEIQEQTKIAKKYAFKPSEWEIDNPEEDDEY